MAKYKRLVAACLVAATALVPAMAAAPVAADSGTRQIQSGGAANPVAGPTASVDGLVPHELRPDLDARSNVSGTAGPDLRNVEFGPAGADAQTNAPSSPASTQRLSFNGLNARQQRLANGGNQFSLEPPDQGLCVGNGFVLETVNDVLRVFDSNGAPVTGVVDLNSFYRYPPALNRLTGFRGPIIADPSCLYDTATQRWFHLVLTLDVDAVSGAFTGRNHLDLAVSRTSNPAGAWTLFTIPVQDDGTEGTPNHMCQAEPASGSGPERTHPNACLGDFPHIGADQYGIFLTTNEYSFFVTSTPANVAAFHAAQIYALSKKALVSGATSVALTQIDTLGMLNNRPGFTVWPATSPSSADYERSGNGTEYFTSTNAAEEASNVPNAKGVNASNQVGVWALSNTASLDAASPSPKLRTTTVRVDRYSVPPPSNQKPGPFPLGQCINDTTTPTPFETIGCWTALFNPPAPPHTEVEGPLDSSDSRVLSTVFAGGHLWGTLDTGVGVGGKTRAAVQYYAIKPDVDDRRLRAVLERQGRVVVPNNNTIYGAVAVTHAGQALIGFTLVGNDHYPSAAYVSVNSKVTPARIHVAAEGLGPQDGFSEYNAFAAGPVTRPRWGDYGAAVADGDTIWIANEYTGQSCTLQQYMLNTSASPFGSCGGTRTILMNWYTRVTAVDVSRAAAEDDGNNQSGNEN